jgi:hypothetical protein
VRGAQRRSALRRLLPSVYPSALFLPCPFYNRRHLFLSLVRLAFQLTPFHFAGARYSRDGVCGVVSFLACCRRFQCCLNNALSKTVFLSVFVIFIFACCL